MIQRILFLAPYSVPINNPEAICNAKLIKALSEAGYEIDVISKNNNHAYTPDTDDKLFVDKVRSIKTFVLKNEINLKTIIDHVRVYLKTGYVYKGAHWAWYAIKEAEKLMQLHEYNLIMSRSPASELAALYLSQKYQIKWIANWNDPYPDACYPVPYGQGPKVKLGRLQRLLLKKISEKADFHTFPSERLMKYMSQYMNLSRKNSILIIPHLCIDHLFEDEKKHESCFLRVIHSGNVSFPRSPQPLFDGLCLFKKRNKKAVFEISFIGKQDQNFMNLVKKCGLEDNVKIIPPKEYIANLKLMSEYDLALLIEADMEEGIFLPTKVGDYMQSHLPIWSVSPKKGEMNDLYLKKKIAYFSNISSVEEIVQTFEKIYIDYIANGNFLPKREIIKEYSCEEILHFYTNVFKRL